jgi:hypothetical protein
MSYSESDVKEVLSQVTRKVMGHPQVSGTDYGLDENGKQLEVRIYANSEISHDQLGISPEINNVPVRIIKDGPFVPQ